MISTSQESARLLQSWIYHVLHGVSTHTGYELYELLFPFLVACHVIFNGQSYVKFFIFYFILFYFLQID